MVQPGEAVLQHWRVFAQASGARHARTLAQFGLAGRKVGIATGSVFGCGSQVLVPSVSLTVERGGGGETGRRCLPCLATCSLQGGSVDCPRVGALQFTRIVDEQPGLQHGVVGQAVEVGFGNADFTQRGFNANPFCKFFDCDDQ